MTATKSIRNLIDLEYWQKRLDAAGYNLTDYNEYLSVETWRKENKYIILELEEDC